MIVEVPDGVTTDCGGEGGIQNEEELALAVDGHESAFKSFGDWEPRNRVEPACLRGLGESGHHGSR
ncbi:MAG: hypothetical protein AUH11_10020 [Acidobacteria bacterium 13_2_20CM_57_17]|nr:MAG: hypothetical protein AUH11_10020 [Acidobacteria bacterium 13_2_20CM_57_17]